MTDEFSIIFVTSTKEGSEVIARALVEERLAACVNVSGVNSYFIWEEEFCSEKEALLIIKSLTVNVERIIERVKELHDYDLPEIIAIPIIAGDKRYLNWVKESVV
ncbi:MAG: divalent-cation tolerance protein CutA [Halobacteriota archaeon]|nr:divalent-cation tolerance protein CutA [Halobacteriota archaeon]